LNHVNYGAPVGTLNSPFFGELLASAPGGPGADKAGKAEVKVADRVAAVVQPVTERSNSVCDSSSDASLH